MSLWDSKYPSIISLWNWIKPGNVKNTDGVKIHQSVLLFVCVWHQTYTRKSKIQKTMSQWRHVIFFKTS